MVLKMYRFNKNGNLNLMLALSSGRVAQFIADTWLFRAGIFKQVIANSKREESKKKDRPKFIYYRLLDDISRAFNMAKEIFRFRKPRPPIFAPTIDAKHIYQPNGWC